jgi:FlaA1/EpsC-like NDP-sugar epimerase
MLFIKRQLDSFQISSELRLAYLLAIHGLIWTLALALAYAIRFDFNLTEILAMQRGGFVFLLFLLSRYAAFFYWGMHEISWRHVTTRDLPRIVKAHLAATICLAAFLALVEIPHFPRSVIILHTIFSIIGCMAAPLCVRLLFESLNARLAKAGNTLKREILIIGAGESGHLLVKTMQVRRQLAYQPIGILDDNPSLRGRNVFGVDVIGRVSELKDLLIANPKIAAVILAIPSLSKSRVKEIEDACHSLEVPLKRLQSFEDIALTDLDSNAPTVTSIESVLQRDDTVSNETEVRSFITNKNIAITGAGGSIGSELVRQILNFNPKSLTLIDSNEFHMFKIQREISSTKTAVLKNYCVASIVDEARIGNIFSEHKPEVVFHAAAYKHVPLMEENPYEAVLNNVVGTRNLLRSCVVNGIDHFVFISTDKAVNSCSVMGHSKRIGELLVQAFVAEAKKRAKPMTAAVVRFGNVINSNGSVVPLFKEQILSGGPVTVTHPEMRRFFMSIREAVRLVMAAGTIGRDGEVFLLDMGSPVKIEDVAKKMLALYGRRDIKIEYSGIRPGERLFEELTGPDEETHPTTLAKVNRVTAPAVERHSVMQWVADIEKRVITMSGDEVRSAMVEYLQGPKILDESFMPRLA